MTSSPGRFDGAGGLIVIAVILFVACGGGSMALAQAARTAELEQQLTAAEPGKKSGLLLQLSQALESHDMPRAVDYARQARTAAVLPRDGFKADVQLAGLLRRRSDYGEGFALVRESLARAAAAGDRLSRAELLLVLARFHASVADFPAALAAYQELVALAEQLGNRALVARGHIGIGLIYGERDERLKARAEARLALAIAEEIGDRHLESDVLNNLGNNYLMAGDPAEARGMHERALALRTALGNRRGVGDSSLNLGRTVAALGDYALALEKLQEALTIYEELQFPWSIASAHLEIARVLRLTGRPDEALERLRVGFAAAEPLGDNTLLSYFHREFAKLHETRGEWRAAYESGRKHAAVTDVVMGEKSRQQLAALNVRFDTERRQQQITLLERERALKDAELDRARWRGYGLIAGVALAALAVVALVSRQRMKLAAERRARADAEAARQAADEANQLKTRLLGFASHDLKGPLATLSAATHALDRSAAGSPEVRKLVGTMRAETARMTHLVHDFLDRSALDAGRLELRPEPLDLAHVAARVVADLGPLAAQKKQSLTLETPSEPLPLVAGEAPRLEQVFANLVGNAIKYTPHEGAIRVVLGHDDAGVWCEVRDSGPGLAPAELARLFQPFTRLSSKVTGGEASSGLGLYLAHELVALHGGTLQVDSQPGEGAAFRVTLAALECPAGGTTTAAAATPSAPGLRHRAAPVSA